MLSPLSHNTLSTNLSAIPFHAMRRASGDSPSRPNGCSRLSNRRIVARHQPVMFGKPRQRDLQHSIFEVARTCRS
jgi:hypothetical protein